MSTAKPVYGSAASYAVAASLAAANYDYSGPAYNTTTNSPVDVLFEYAATVAASSTGNRQIALFVVGSLDGTTWPALPSSATDATHDTSMTPLGSIPTNGGASSESERRTFSIAAAFGNGVIPPYWRVIIKNDCGVAMSSCSARTQEVSISVA